MIAKIIVVGVIIFSAVAALSYQAYSSRALSNKAEARSYLIAARNSLDSSNYEKSNRLLEKVISYGFDAYTLEAMVWQGELLSRQGRYDEMKEVYQKASAFLPSSPEPKWRAAKISDGFAWFYLQKGMYDSALFFSARSLSEDTLPFSYASARRTMAVIYRRMGNYPKAIENQLESLKLATEIGNTGGIASALNGLGNIYGEIDEDSVAMLYYDSCIAYSIRVNLDATRFSAMCNLALSKLKTGSLDEAEKLANEVLALSLKGGYVSIVPNAYQYLGRVHALKKEYDRSIRFYEMADSIYEQKQSPDRHAIASQLAEVYIDMGNLRMAEQYVNSVIKSATASKNSHKLFLAHIQLFEIDSMRGDFKQANANVRKAWHLRDSIYGLEKMTMIEEASQKYRAEQNQKIIALQKAQLAGDRNNLLIIILVSLTGVITLSTLYLMYRQRQKEILYRLQEESKRKRMNAVLETQERVQQTIARDLHDGLVQTLGAVKLSIESIQPEANSLLTQRLQRSSALIDEACSDVRTISHQLLPHSLNKAGLAGALSELAERSLRSSMKHYEFKISGTVAALNPAIEVHLYRIAQELVNNILRHARATSTFMYLTFLTESLVLWIEDDGQGFNYTKDSLGVGLLNIQTRLEVIHGNINVETAPGRGTSISISVPLS